MKEDEVIKRIKDFWKYWDYTDLYNRIQHLLLLKILEKGEDNSLMVSRNDGNGYRTIIADRETLEVSVLGLSPRYVQYYILEKSPESNWLELDPIKEALDIEGECEELRQYVEHFWDSWMDLLGWYLIRSGPTPLMQLPGLQDNHTSFTVKGIFRYTQQQGEERVRKICRFYDNPDDINLGPLLTDGGVLFGTVIKNIKKWLEKEGVNLEN